MESKYIINIAKNGKHHFRVEIVDRADAKEVYAELKLAYNHKIYEVNVTYWEVSGTGVHW